MTTRLGPTAFAALLVLLVACTREHDLTIHQPASGATFPQSATITLDAEIRGGEHGCGGEDCNCATWRWTSGGTALGLDRNNGSEVSFCRYTWSLPATGLGVGSHTLELHAEQSGYRESTASVQITVQP